jgi:CubicO group peptidase (beta-lactamase class C family)
MEKPEILGAELVDGMLARAAQADVPVPWWSFTKTVLAAAALALVRDGKLALDAPAAGRSFTLRQLLQHTAGVRNYGGLESYHAAVARGDGPWSADELLRRVPPADLLFPPGEGWAYSNVGYLLVRQSIEDAAGDTLGAALQRLVLAPLGIEDARIAYVPADLDGVAWGNARRYHPGWVFHGLLVGPPTAAVEFLDRLLTGHLLPSALKAAMLIPRAIGGPFPGRPFRAPSYGLGVIIDTEGPRGRCVGHTGQGPGSTSAVYHFPDLVPRRTAAVFAPVDGDAAQGLLESRILELASATARVAERRARPPASPG